ncbi:embigin [Octodon degus]|uniref:Embigin n=1 Tax=Octodon degus TaxID=10160 RepID=A0A6P6DPJ9_OCTDE|nr:embigin [Octodon degus]
MLEKNITLESPSLVSLTCEFTPSGNVTLVNVTWTRGTELMLRSPHAVFADNTVHAQYQFSIINSKQMGSYSCLLEGKQEQRGTFNFKVPELSGKNKPFITYVGDTAVLVCKCPKCLPVRWAWYRSNGSEQVPIDALMNDTYVISGTHSNKTKLKIKNLREEDGGAYWCRAEFQLGQSTDQLDLVVLSFLVPLKPFFAIIAEVIVLMSIILLCEVYTKKKKKHPDDGKEFEQIEQLKSDDSNGVENNAPRQRKK